MYFDGCPNVDLAAQRVHAAVASVGLTGDVDVVMTRIGDEVEAARKRFLGSPTVHVDGLDVEADAVARDDYGIQCRVYWHDGRLEGAPPSPWIAAALAARPPTERTETAGPSPSGSIERGEHGCCDGKSTRNL
jgi:hypothetical protein